MLSAKRARRRISCVTWSASSRVGHSTMACTPKWRGFRLGEQRQRERGRLAAAGLGLGDQVVAGQRDRQARRLDRRHRQVVELLQICQHRGRQRQFVERASGRAGCGYRGGRGNFGHARLSSLRREVAGKNSNLHGLPARRRAESYFWPVFSGTIGARYMSRSVQ